MKVGDKVKLDLIQPEIICEGRKRVSCTFRGKITGISLDCKIISIKFKYQNKEVEKFYDIETNEFLDQTLKDIKLRMYPSGQRIINGS